MNAPSGALEAESAVFHDERVVMTLDAGGTKLQFSAVRGGREIVEPEARSARPDDLGASLTAITAGFEAVAEQVRPDAISFSFPGPSYYHLGVIGDLPNLPAFRGGVALGPYLQEHFGIPVYINNDGNLFTLGEWTAGLLPEVNRMLADSGSDKRYRNLLGVTIGTGFGAGMVVDGTMVVGDNDSGGEMWVMRNKLLPEYCVEALVGKQYLRRIFSREAGMAFEDAPDPREIYEIGSSETHPLRTAARRSYEILGEAAGDAIAEASTMLDGLIVIGGGLAGAYSLFAPAMFAELRRKLHHFTGEDVPRMLSLPFDLENEGDRMRFIAGERRIIRIPGSGRELQYDALQRTAIGLSRLGTSRAVALGAYVFALRALDRSHAR